MRERRSLEEFTLLCVYNCNGNQDSSLPKSVNSGRTAPNQAISARSGDNKTNKITCKPRDKNIGWTAGRPLETEQERDVVLVVLKVIRFIYLFVSENKATCEVMS